MGVSSSKGKKTKSQVSSKTANNMARVKAKSSKVKAKKSSAWSRADGVGGEVTYVPGNRRPSSDVEDLQFPPQRGRSRSLRFGDFTQLDRLHKVNDVDLLPLDIAFFQDGKVEPEELCHVCSVYTGCETLLCGVCYRAFHQGCLAKIGQWSGPSDLLTATSGLWSCHQCANLGNLLTEEEVTEVLRRLDKCGIRREDDLTSRDYLAYCHMSLQEDEDKVLTREKAENAKRRFSQVDSENRGRITWCQFLNIETVRILKKRNKNALIRLLTAPELERARDAFRILDTDKDGRITKATAHDALDRNSRRSGYYPDETMMYIDEDLNQSISWMEFLRDRAIYIIAERPCLRASYLDHSTCRRGSNRSSLSAATSLPVTPTAKTPPTQRDKGVAKAFSLVSAAFSTPTTPVSKQQQPNANAVFLRHSDGGSSQAFKPISSTTSGCQGHEQGANPRSSVVSATGSTTPGKKQFSAFPLLPPPPFSSRGSPSHHVPRGVSSQHQALSNAYHENSSGGSGTSSKDSFAGSRLSGGSDGGGSARRISDHTRRSSQEDPSHGSGHVNGKPPMGSHGRAIAAPPFGKLVERVQKGEYRHNQARSMLLNAQITPTFGHVTGDSTGRRPLSLV